MLLEHNSSLQVSMGQAVMSETAMQPATEADEREEIQAFAKRTTEFAPLGKKQHISFPNYYF